MMFKAFPLLRIKVIHITTFPTRYINLRQNGAGWNFHFSSLFRFYAQTVLTFSKIITWSAREMTRLSNNNKLSFSNTTFGYINILLCDFKNDKHQIPMKSTWSSICGIWNWSLFFFWISAYKGVEHLANFVSNLPTLPTSENLLFSKKQQQQKTTTTKTNRQKKEVKWCTFDV